MQQLGMYHLKDFDTPLMLFQVCHPDLPRDFAPPRVSPAEVRNLPASLSSFVGREREIAEVEELLVAGRLVTLTVLADAVRPAWPLKSPPGSSTFSPTGCGS